MDETRHGPDSHGRPSPGHCPPTGAEDRQTPEGRLRRELEREKRCCANCVYATRPRGRWFRVILSHFAGLLICTNSSDARGQMRGVTPCGVCRNFRRRRPPLVRAAPPAPLDDKTCYIPLTRGYCAMVDPEDYEWLSRHRWHVKVRGRRRYALRVERGKTIFMHREIMKTPKGMVVDHIDGNGLDNHRANMRNCTPRQNLCNRRPRRDSARRYAGVYQYGRRPGQWCACLRSGGRKTRVGPFDSEIEAARARDRLAVERYGLYAWVNLPEEWPPERRAAVIEEARKQGRTPGSPRGKECKRE